MKAVLDIGKTNVKFQLVDESGCISESYAQKNTPLMTGPYSHADVAGIWQWLIETLQSSTKTREITAIIITTHGATAALVNRLDLSHHDGLVLPVLDYEYTGIHDDDENYQRVRPEFSETLSPDLPAGLNLGRQIFWLQQHFAADFERADCLLMYPQYWAWRLTGKAAAEVTSLGCHTDLWSPVKKDYSTLVQNCHWQRLMPPMQSAWQVLGCVTPTLATLTGLSLDCKVHLGLHDSNASYLRYVINASSQESFTVISTGTWTILMQAQGNLESLSHSRDTLANCDIFAEPVACARFMGGREYEVICQRLGGDVNAMVNREQVQSAIQNHWMVTPDFSNGNGPFGGREPDIECTALVSGAAIATLYCALMIDQRLNDLQSTGPIYIEGAFLKNPILCQLVAQLRSGQTVYLSADDTGTVQGALLLMTPDFASNKSRPTLNLQSCQAADFVGLMDYRAAWYQLIARIPEK